MAVVAILVPILVLFLLGTKEQEKIPVSYRVVEDDRAIDSSINPYMLGKDLVIEYKSSVKPRVEGPVNYTVLDDRVIVYNYSNQHFRLIFGYSSDVYEFGNVTIENAQTYTTKYLGTTAVSGLGGTYWNLTDTTGTANTATSVKNAKNTGKFYFKPGTGSSTSTGNPDSGTPVGYGWGTDYTLAGTIPAGTWTFQVKTTSSSATGAGYMGVVVYKNCSGVSTRLFGVFNNTFNVLSSTSALITVITTSQPSFDVGGCYLKAEYWLNVTTAGTSSTGTVTFTVNEASEFVQFPTPVDTTPPTYSLNSTNSTLAGTSVEHSLYWQDNFGLNYAIFSFDNCTGNLQNITGMSLSGTSAWSNFTVGINSTVGCTIRWCVYANDTSNNWNGTSCLQPFSYTTTSAAVPQVYERNLSISFTQSVSTARSVNMQRGFSQYVYLPVQFVRYETIGRTGDISISTITEFLRSALYTRDFSTSTSVVAELLRNAGYARDFFTSANVTTEFLRNVNYTRSVFTSINTLTEFFRTAIYGRGTSTSISTVTEFFRTASYGRSIFTGISALVEFFKLIRPLDYCFEIRRDGNTVTCVKDKVSQVNCLDITDINNWVYICELADRMLMVIKL
jgi:hypothetical protein